jgi:hypothetical protein
MLTAVQRRREGQVTGLPAAHIPRSGRHAELLRLASAIGNRGMAQIARQPTWGQWYGPPMGGGYDVEDEEMSLPPGLDLSFLDDDELQDIDVPRGLDLSFLDDDDVVVTAAPAPQQAAMTEAPVPQQAAVTQLPVAQQAVHVPAPAVQAPVAPARNVAAELDAFKSQQEIKNLTRKVNELLGAGLVDVSFSEPYVLGSPNRPKPKGDRVTLERLVTVKAKGRAAVLAKFVVHYHPNAAKASAKSGAYSSQMHVKTFADSDKANRDEITHGTHAHLNKVIPKFGPSVKNWQSAPVGWGHQKPKKKTHS